VIKLVKVQLKSSYVIGLFYNVAAFFIACSLPIKEQSLSDNLFYQLLI